MQTQPEVVVRVNPDLEPDASQEAKQQDAVEAQDEKRVVSPIRF